MITAILNTKIGEIENKIPDITDLVKKTDYDAKISKAEGKYILLLPIIINILDA